MCCSVCRDGLNVLYSQVTCFVELVYEGDTGNPRLGQYAHTSICNLHGIMLKPMCTVTLATVLHLHHSAATALWRTILGPVILTEGDRRLVVNSMQTLSAVHTMFTAVGLAFASTKMACAVLQSIFCL